MTKINIQGPGGASLPNGNLQVDNPLDNTLQVVKDTAGTGSPLELSTDLVSVSSTLQIATDDTTYIDAEDSLGNNRFTVSRVVGQQHVNIDFASNPTLNEKVGAIRTYQDGVNLTDAISVEKNGQTTFTERVKIEADSTATTQSTAVIQSSTTNAGIALVPNGTGAITASIPDGTATGGNARGQYAVDLKPGGRTGNTQVASGNYSAVIGGNVSTASGFLSLAGGSAFATGAHSVALGGSSLASGNGSVAIGGEQGGGLGATASGRAAIAFGLGNTATAAFSNSLGGNGNNATSSASTISGGQSNTASTGTHATVVGGSGNTSSGQYSVSGGQSNTASGAKSVSFGSGNNATANSSIALGTNSSAYLLGQLAHASEFFSTNGDAQQSYLTARKSDTLDSATTTVLSLDGTGTTSLIIPLNNNRVWNVTVKTVAVVTAIAGTATGVTVGDVFMENKSILFKRISGVSSVVDLATDNTFADGLMGTSSMAYTAGASQELALTYTGPTFVGGGSVTVRVVSKVELVEVAY